jgi:8-oxo-dGTP pyrophosphatase MutT (NUDIX family)
MIKEYVLGFAFKRSTREVVLIEKKLEDGKRYLNGIGGKIEENESALHAMQREFEEEVGIYVGADRWKRFGSMGGDKISPVWRCELYVVELEDFEMLDAWRKVHSDHDDIEESSSDPRIKVVSPADGAINEMPAERGVPWLIPMAYEALVACQNLFVSIRY